MPEISKTVDQALTVLTRLTDSSPQTVVELSRTLKMNRTVVHRLLNTLQRHGLVIRQADGYGPGAVLVRMAAKVQPELRAAAAVVMAQLADDIGETVVLHIVDGTRAVVLEQVVGIRNVVRVEHAIGERSPLGLGASGRVLLAFLDAGAVKRVLAAADDSEAARAQLESVRQLGYAVSHGELQDDVSGLAVPVGNAVVTVAALAILVPTSRSSTLIKHLPTLTVAAARVADAIGMSDARARAA